MTPRKPQINFQVVPSMKTLYEAAQLNGQRVTRLCAAGFLLMIEDPAARQRALTRLRDWEVEYEHASEAQIRALVEGAAAAMRGAAPETAPSPAARPQKKAAKRRKS